ncbi:TAXI family TRAP transporter solute-binding subunit [Oleisolibacter albus]|uniref:TAXI family TRAP transporter solute-binding subunit n=1 Tax=Oleisolibacter albus TaxID=2171757 RepID=UPI00138FBA18|nr:TAXI family TRAP transporter solute-binding subunit [Oleisolibacter albus]
MTVSRRCRRLLPGMAALLSLWTLSTAAQPPAVAEMLVGTGGVTGLYYPVGGAICHLLNGLQDKGRPPCHVVPSDGSLANIAALRAGSIDYALVQNDWQRLALAGEGRLSAAGPFADLRAVMSLHAESVTILARPDAEIAGLADLKGKRVNAGPPGSALRLLAEAVLAPLGKLPAADLAGLPPDEALSALCDGQVDAVVLAVGHPNGAVQSAVTTCAAVPVGLTAEERTRILADSPDLVATRIPAGTYPGVTEEVQTVGLVATLVTRADVPDNAVQTVVSALLARFDAFQGEHPALAGLKRADLPGLGRAAPLHPGAEQAYRAAGLLP